MYRGLWINFCATDGEIQKFSEIDRLPLNTQEMADAIDDKYRGEGFFDDLKKRTWAALCSSAHAGMLQLARRFTGHQLKPAYRDGEIFEITTALTTAVLTLTSKFLAVQKLVKESKAIEQLIASYGPVAKQLAHPSAAAPGSG